MDRLQSMRAFERVVAEKGFSAGARKLGLSPATVTRLVRDLEDHLGVRLLQRSTRHLALTAAGECYLEQLRTILCDIERAEEAVHSQAHEMSGVVRVMSLPGLATHLVAPAIAGFRKMHPRITIELQADMLASRAVESHDVTLVTDHVALPTHVVARPVARGDSVLCASPDYLARQGEPLTPEDLGDHAFLRITPPGVPARRPLHLFHPSDPGQGSEVPITPMLSSNDHETVLRSTLEGAGISSQALQVAAPWIRAGRLRRVLDPWLTERYQLLAIFASRRHMPVRTRAFLDHLIRHAARTRDGVRIGPDDPLPAVALSWFEPQPIGLAEAPA